LKKDPAQLDRGLGVTESLSIVINRIIGSGIFRTPASIMMAVTASLPLFFGVWLLGGLATLLAALCYAELVAMMPRSGGPYVFLKAAYPTAVTFLRGWAMFFVSETGSIAIVAIFFSQTLLSFFPDRASPFVIAAVAIALILFHTILNCYGIKLGGIVQNIFSILKLTTLIFIVVMALASGFHYHNFSSPHSTTNLGGWVAALGFFKAMRYGFYAYSGWEGATYVAEEIKNPARNLPLSLFGGITLVMLIYLLTNLGYVNVLGPQRIAAIFGSQTTVAASSMQTAMGAIGGGFVLVAILISAFGNVNTQILVKSRTWFAMARDGLFFSKLSWVHPKYKTPNNSLYAQAIWASLLILFASRAGWKSYEAIIDYFSFTSSIFNILTFASVFVLRRQAPDLPRPYRTWGYPYTLILILLIEAMFLVFTLVTSFIPSLLGVLLTSTGLLYYKFVLPDSAKKRSTPV
jgi:APA family basic amino acid/polyamine antiporter